MDTTKSVAAVQELEQRIEKIEAELLGLRRVLADLRDHALADEIIAGVDESKEDANDEEANDLAAVRIETARAEQQAAVEQCERVKEALSPLKDVCLEIEKHITDACAFECVPDGLSRFAGLVDDRDVEGLVDLMNGISRLFDAHGRTLSRTTRRFLMDQTRDVVYVLIEEYVHLMDQGRADEAEGIREAMTMTGVIRLEKMIEEKDLPQLVVSRMEQPGLAFVGDRKATHLLDALEGSSGAQEEGEAVQEKLLVFAQKIKEAQSETRQAGEKHRLAKQGCINRSRALVREAKEIKFSPSAMRVIERLITTGELPQEVTDLMDKEAEEAIVMAEEGKKARMLLYSLVGTVFRLKPQRGGVGEDESKDEPATENLERARRRAEREEKRKARIKNDRDYTRKMHGHNPPAPKHGKKK